LALESLTDYTTILAHQWSRCFDVEKVIQRKPKSMNKQQFIIFSPILVVLICNIIIRLAEPSLGVWAWIPWILVYWVGICFLALWGSERGSVKRWMAPPQGSWLWLGLAILLAIPSLFMFVSSWQLLKSIYVWLPWLIVGLVNPFLEEWYWRGLLLDATKVWPSWISILGTSILFALNHLFGIGVTSIGGRHPVLLVNTFMFGVIFGVIYKKTNSLRWLIIAHALTDLFGLSVAVFLNLWVPPG
jgi:CAAX protease family protein